MSYSPHAGVSPLRLGALVILLGALLLLIGGRTCVRPVASAPDTGSSSGWQARLPHTGSGTGIAVLALKQAPPHVRRMIDYLRNVRHFRPPAGYRGGRLFRNREGLLPKGRTYYEFDVHPLRPGVSRGAERLVVDQNKRFFYYTRDHYRTFTKIDVP